MDEEQLNMLEAKLPDLQRASNEFGALLSSLEAIQGKISAVDSEAGTVGELFNENYRGSRVDIHVSIGDVKAGTNQALQAISRLISEIQSYKSKINNLYLNYAQLLRDAGRM